MIIPDKILEKMWDENDWEAAEAKLSDLQKRLTIAAFAHNSEEIERLQKIIVRDINIKCLAVKKVADSNASMGVDKVRWKTSAEKMQAAISLTSKNYHASPMRQVVITAKNSGKERRPQIPTYHDRAMSILYGYSLLPVVEAWADHKSFAFRPARSAQDAHAYILQLLEEDNAPEFVVCADIKSYYASIHHDWLLEHVPMDKSVLREFLNAGIVFAGELFPPSDTGISEGSSISPYLGNFVLDGLQATIFRNLQGTDKSDELDYSNGNMIRFADDVMITARTQSDAEKILECLINFLDERGLRLSPEKTKICRVTEGFTFLSRTYIRKNGYIHAYPSERAVERFISELRVTLINNRRSQRDLIETLNKKLKGWAAYHRYTDAAEAFKKVDTALQSALLEAARLKHPKLPMPKIISKYWYKMPDGEHIYALPDDKSVRLYKLRDTVLVSHHKIRAGANPFVDTDYFEERTHKKEIKNVTGKYRTIWDRQGGMCFYCGRPILDDQPRTIMLLDPSKSPSAANSVYVHEICASSEYEIIRTEKDTDTMRPYDVCETLEKIIEKKKNQGEKGEISPHWKYYDLKMYFAKCTAASVALTFGEIEKINGHQLPLSARQRKPWWYSKNTVNSIAEAWLTEGYKMRRLDLKREEISFYRVEEGVSSLNIPDVLLHGKLPENAVFELENFMEYIILKYGIKRKGG